MLIQTSQLNKKQLLELKQLQRACKVADQHIIPIYPHILIEPRQKPSTFLYYENERLIGFVSAYFFYDNACEVALMVDPAFRRQKIASVLLASLLPFIDSEEVVQVIVSSTEKAKDSWLPSWGFRYYESEYEMIRFSNEKIVLESPRLHFKKASIDDASFLCKADSLCFPDYPHDIRTRILALLNDRAYRLVIASINEQPVGKAHIHWIREGAKLSDIAILPDLQAQGLGRELIAYCINYALDQKKPRLCLDVQTKNSHAIKLYARLGFEIETMCDYWVSTTKRLLQQINSLSPL
ncbi:GNAT family N-acetyltransferase [Legionella yabuuchiae]|uniref:GNAT family N-acetyltransferase n=1 Tax=Legionella yabuuchiae TaxID=376727 RepID=UPI001055E7D7|nr:GNAT family N-acetyltransferase [Legionella yabuuchiae]